MVASTHDDGSASCRGAVAATPRRTERPPVTDIHSTLGSLLATLKALPLTEQQACTVDLHLRQFLDNLKPLFKIHQLDPAYNPTLPSVTIQTQQLTYCSAAMHRLVQVAARAASRDVPILITGETGVGKELLAQFIHLNSANRNVPLVPLNCAAVPRELFESHLFGHKQGAFSGAAREAIGVIRAANGGTLLLDEIGELPLDLQPKLLRFLQEGEVQAVGETRPSVAQVRIIASTNRRLEEEVAAGRFRADLFHRLKVITLNVPPLRERREDVPVLIRFFLDRLARKFGHEALRLAPDVMERLLTYSYPGNVRELSNLLLSVAITAEPGALVTLADLPPEVLHARPEVGSVTSQNARGEAPSPAAPAHPSSMKLNEAVSSVERQQICDALQRHDGNFARAARDLGMSTFGLRKKHRRLFPAVDSEADASAATARST